MEVQQTNREQLLNEVKQIVLPAFRAFDAQIYLFGSWARGEERAASDIDIAVKSQNSIPATIFAQTRERLEESLIPCRIDLVNLYESSESFKAEVLKEGILWTE